MFMLDTLNKVSNTVNDFNTPDQFNVWLMQTGVSAKHNDTAELCVTDNYVRGCTSNVWINGKLSSGHWLFNFYSDTTMTKGVGSILTTALNGLTSEQVNNVTFSDFNFLATNLTLAKKKGLQAMINHIKRIVNT